MKKQFQVMKSVGVFPWHGEDSFTHTFFTKKSDPELYAEFEVVQGSLDWKIQATVSEDSTAMYTTWTRREENDEGAIVTQYSILM